MAQRHWSLDDVPWGAFDASRVDQDLINVVKAASLVERNARDYVTYLCNVFGDDPAVQDVVHQWGEEEVQHGDALGRWGEMADPTFDFEESFRRFRAAYSVPVDAEDSIRGSRAREMVARCVVEIGTSSMYSALRDATDEPVLKYICGQIAKDEFRHYKLFYKQLQRYRSEDRWGLLGRAMVAYQRFDEIDDDELPMAYHCANTAERTYDRETSVGAYAHRVFRHYRRDHVDRAVTMTFRSVGISPRGPLPALASRFAWNRLQRHLQTLPQA